MEIVDVYEMNLKLIK